MTTTTSSGTTIAAAAATTMTTTATIVATTTTNAATTAIWHLTFQYNSPMWNTIKYVSIWYITLVNKHCTTPL